VDSLGFISLQLLVLLPSELLFVFLVVDIRDVSVEAFGFKSCYFLNLFLFSTFSSLRL
jgi:hypothetical protein